MIFPRESSQKEASKLKLTIERYMKGFGKKVNEARWEKKIYQHKNQGGKSNLSDYGVQKRCLPMQVSWYRVRKEY